MQLTIYHEYGALPCPEQSLRSVGRKIYQAYAKHRTGPVNLVLCSSRYIRNLNRTFRKKDGVTDVLSFNYADTEMPGEIYISLQRAKTQARRYGHTYTDEVIRLFVHGMFHLLGYDHKTVRERDEMEKQEKRFFHHL